MRFRRGPYPTNPAVLPEGYPCETGIVTPDGSVFEMLWVGSHDGANKLLGGGFQTCRGEPSFSAPAGASVYDTLNQYLWVSNGDGTWTAFCPCIINSGASGSGAGSGAGSGGDNAIYTACCGNVSPTLHLLLTVADNRGANAVVLTVPLSFAAGQGWIASQLVTGSNPRAGQAFDAGPGTIGTLLIVPYTGQGATSVQLACVGTYPGEPGTQLTDTTASQPYWKLLVNLSDNSFEGLDALLSYPCTWSGNVPQGGPPTSVTCAPIDIVWRGFSETIFMQALGHPGQGYALQIQKAEVIL